MEVEHWLPAHEISVVTAISVREVMSAFDAVRRTESATLTFWRHHEDEMPNYEQGLDLIIGVSRGCYMATAADGDGDWLELIGDPCATGEVELVVGGQSAGHPRRQLVTEEDAMAVAVEFTTTGELNFASRQWVHC
ncbi:Imm1 family immunity protein [Streptomyces sp. NBC_01727]|uniref:Imm1 family immunity protein n=1 Tax=Streptomyces sp. NBC_01727 TaxID=2975924 RepID=UPI002E12E2BD|nr:Imm1 family immunity protein [Streptomyces sp. NBC_01727]